jgi:hypothetical protein
MPWSYYIYYRVEAAHTAACGEAVEKLLDTVHKRTGTRGRVLKKRNEPLLWMEIYENVADEAKFEWELAEAVADTKIQSLLQPGSSRHTECFSG